MRPLADHGEESYRPCGRLDGLVAIVTGGDSGISRAISITFTREGADVAIAYLDDMEDEDPQETREWVEPGPVLTPLIPPTFPAEHVRECGKSTIWGRPAQPAEIAPSFAFLASADSRFYTGEIFAPTGEITTR